MRTSSTDKFGTAAATLKNVEFEAIQINSPGTIVPSGDILCLNKGR